MQISARGYLLQGNGCGGCGGCGDCGGGGSGQPFDLSFRYGAQTYAAARQGDQQIATLPNQFVDLAPAEGLASIELVALRSSGPVTLRIDGAPASYATAAVWPVAGLTGLTLGFGVDGYPVAVTFVSGDDTADEVTRRINAAAALAGVPFFPASVNALGQVALSGRQTGLQGALAAPTGSALAALGLASQPSVVGLGQDLAVDGLYVQQLTRAKGARSIQVSGQATLQVLVAGS